MADLRACCLMATTKPSASNSGGYIPLAKSRTALIACPASSSSWASNAAAFSAPARSANLRVGPSLTFNATSCCCGPLSRSFSSVRRASSAEVRTRSREASRSATCRRSCSVSRAFRKASPIPDARSANSASSAGVTMSPRSLTSEIPPRASPSWNTGTE